MSTPPQPNPTPPAPPNPAPPVTPPAPPAPNPAAPAAPPAPPAPAITDWQAEARKWEARAKDNKTAADELATLKASQMSDQERAVTEAEAKGRTAAAAEYGQQLAVARFEAAAATAGVQLGEAAELIDTARFVAADGTVDTVAITAAVATLAKLAPPAAGRSGGDFGGSGGEQPLDLDAQIEAAQKAGNVGLSMRLKRQRGAQTT